MSDPTPDKLIRAIIQHKAKERGPFPLKAHIAEAPLESVKETCHAISYVEILPTDNRHQEQCKTLALRHLRLAYYFLDQGFPGGVEAAYERIQNDEKA